MKSKYKTKTKTLKNSEEKLVQIEVTLFTGSSGISLLTDILKSISPSLLSALSTKKTLEEDSEKSELDINLKDVSENLVNNIFDGKLLELIKRILSCTRLDDLDLSTDSGFDIAFCGEYGLLADAITFVLEANYKSFLFGNITKVLKNMVMKNVKEVSKKS